LPDWPGWKRLIFPVFALLLQALQSQKLASLLQLALILAPGGSFLRSHPSPLRLFRRDDDRLRALPVRPPPPASHTPHGKSVARRILRGRPFGRMLPRISKSAHSAKAAVVAATKRGFFSAALPQRGAPHGRKKFVSHSNVPAPSR
jgi:hypothetical protein